MKSAALTGEVAWARLSSGPTQVVGATPIALFRRENAGAWTGRLQATDAGADVSRPEDAVLELLRTRGASFAHEIAAACGLSNDALRSALADLVAAGLITSDGFSGLRGLIDRSTLVAPSRSPRPDSAGRWAMLSGTETAPSDRAETVAWTLLRRYGVIFRRLLTRESTDVPWRDVARVCRKLEARGEIRGGRFVTGMSGEQFALTDAVDRLREVRRTAPDDSLITISAADPLNLVGIVTSDDRIRTATSTRVVYQNGIAVAAMEGDMLRILAPVDPSRAQEVASAAAGRHAPALSGYLGR
jgi:ATP-dependent Lhr-like helicase